MEVKNTSPMSEQDSGILDVEDEEEDEEVTGCHQTQGIGQLGEISCVSVLAPHSAFCAPMQHAIKMLCRWWSLSELGHFALLSLLAGSAEMFSVVGEQSSSCLQSCSSVAFQSR